MSQDKTPRTPSARIKINPPVFFGSAGMTIVFVVLTLLFPEGAAELFGSIQLWIIHSAGWFYILAVATFLLLVVFLGISQFGGIKLGPDHSEPDYSYISWFAMLFSAGMGIGLMFFGVAEPVMHLLMPPAGDPGTFAAARQAMRITFFQLFLLCPTAPSYTAGLYPARHGRPTCRGA
jgi:choline/glycine/proline betaine transport protein